MDLQNVNSHHFSIGSYQFDLSILPGALHFNITCSSSFAKYTATIDSLSIKQNKNIDFFFSTPEDLFSYFLGDCTNNVQLRDGNILFNIQTRLGNAVKNYECVIETAKQELDSQAILALKFQRLEKEIDGLKVENSNLKEKIGKQEAETDEIKEEVEKCQKELSRKDQAITNIFKALKDLQEWKKQKQLQFSMPIASQRRFIADQTNPHNKKFNEIANRYRKNCGGTWDILISKYPIERNEVTKYHIKQIRAGSNGSFMYGIGTQAVKGLNRAQDSKEFIGYYENTGFIYDQAESKKGGPKIKDGDTVTMEIDTKKWKIAWFIQGKKQAETTIANELRNKPIYLAIVVFNEQSEIEFL